MALFPHPPTAYRVQNAPTPSGRWSAESSYRYRRLSRKKLQSKNLDTFEALTKVPFPVIMRSRSYRRISVFQEVEILRFAQDDRRTNFARGSLVILNGA